MWTAPRLGGCSRHMRGKGNFGFEGGKRAEGITESDTEIEAVGHAKRLQAGNDWVGDLSQDDLSRHH